MAITKKTNKKPQLKKVVTKKIDDTTVEVVKPITDEEKIFGAQPETVLEKNINYESPKINYKVTNLKVNNHPTVVSGEFIETFIGISNLQAREALKRGVKMVITLDNEGNDAYKLEVL